MATAFWNLNTCVSGLTKLHYFRLSKEHGVPKRSYLDTRRLSGSCRNAQEAFLGTFRRAEVRHCTRASGNDADLGSFHAEGDKKQSVSKATLIWRAVKLPIYSVAFIPLTVGSAAAYLETGLFSSWRYSVLLISSVFIITWLNLSNDVYDFDTGADKNKLESVVNLVGSRTGTIVAAYLLLVLGFTGLSLVSFEAGNLRAISLLASAIIFGYIYQCPPFRLSYQGLGEPLCFAAFGPFATTAFYLLQGSGSKMMYLPFTGPILSASLLVGITTTLILFCSHFHQIEEDRAVAKMSPLVMLGGKRGSGIVQLAVTGLYVLAFAFGLSRALPITCIFFCAITLPVARLVVRYVQENHNDKHKIFMAKYFCVRLHSLFGVALAAGLVVARTAPKISIPRLGFS
ncbi:2-carboxy-1,4-naphthoquinone phytyltransferase, chloroplastic [Argentina anserina]|uniref:2-carboxy-1,4-naphthoquinone phytyltransferase, chloroplastic n=1 Tax=Argentina anserina TaxID=57926 RepID=UPI00217658D9|nr:2-carboxy-1,4-naphthoquinone phytyltransferase, chloroplastic [Potentilla anserina]